MAPSTELTLLEKSGPAALSDKLYDWLLSLFIFVTLFLPSGSVYHINLKLPLYAGVLPLALLSFFRNGRATVPALLRLMGIPLLAALWLLIAFFYAIPLAGALRQYTDVALTLLLCWLVLVFWNEDSDKLLWFLRLVIHAEIAAALLKLAIVLYSIHRGVPIVEVMSTLSNVFGVNLMTEDLGSLLGRIQFVSDAAIPVSMYAVLRHRDALRLGNFRAALTILLLLLSVLISFSRYFWAFTILCFFLGLLLGKRDRFQAILLGFLSILVLAALPYLAVLYELRFSHDVAGFSDDLRTRQAVVLKDFFLDAPLLGHGFGSYTPHLVRETEADASRYSYEMQIVALAGQVGVTGLLCFLVLLAWYYRALWWQTQVSLRDRLSLSLILICWLAAGFYNPLLLNPVASVIYATIAALTSLARIAPPGTTSNSLGATKPSVGPPDTTRPLLR